MRLARSAVVVLVMLTLGTGGATAVDQKILLLPFAKKMELAKAGDAEAKMAVGEAFELGQGVKTSAVDAAKWYREAALAGNLDAQFRLAKLVNSGAKGLTADKAATLKLLQAAAQKGHAPSQNLYGMMLENGDGVPKDLKTAALWLSKAAKHGYAEGQNNYGIMLLKGLGVERDLDEAFNWFKKAADQNYGWALNNLGGMYEQGWGTVKDLNKAKELYQKAGALSIEIGKKNFDRLSAALPVAKQ